MLTCRVRVDDAVFHTRSAPQNGCSEVGSSPPTATESLASIVVVLSGVAPTGSERLIGLV